MRKCQDFRLDKSHDTIVIRDVANQTSNEEQYDAESAYLSSITSFYCNKCGVKFDKFWKLHEHIFNSDNHLFSYSKCSDNVGYTIGEVFSHVKDVCGWPAFHLEEARLKTRTFRYYCDKCGKGFKIFKAFVPHYVAHKADSIHCICCSLKLGSVQSLLIHLKRHFVAGAIELNCQICSLQFQALYPYQQHYFIVHSQLANIPFKCCICSEVIFDDEEKFTWHLQKHSDLVRKRKELARTNVEFNKTTCEICSMILTTVEECEKHRAELHLFQNNLNLKKLCPYCAVLINVKDISSHLKCHYKEVINALSNQQLEDKKLKSIILREVPFNQRNIDVNANREIIIRTPVLHPPTCTNIDVPSKPIAEKLVSHQNEKKKADTNIKPLSQDETLAKEQTDWNTKDTPIANRLISTNTEVPQKSSQQTQGRSEKKEMESTHEDAARPKPVQQTDLKKDATVRSSALQPSHSTNIKIHSAEKHGNNEGDQDKNMKLKDVLSDKPDKINAKENIISEKDDGSDDDDCILCESELEVIEIADDSDTHENSASTNKTIQIRKFYCNKCGKLCEDFWTLHQHIFSSPDDHDFECVKCSTKFKNYVEFSKHFRRYCPRNSIVRYEKKQGLTRPKYFCEICGKGFGTLKNFERHCSKHHPNVLLCCSLCSDQYSSFKELLDHSMIHTVIGKIDLVCQICSLHFYSEILFKYHYYMVHSQLELIPFKCYLCGVIIMDDEDKFISHVQSHGDLTKSNRKDVTKLTCEICGEILKSVQKVEMHKSTRHSDFKLIRKQCPFCLKLINFCDLSVHMKNHACFNCKSTFRRQCMENNHICINLSVDSNWALPPIPKPQTITSSTEPYNSADLLMKNLQFPTNTLPPGSQAVTSSGLSYKRTFTGRIKCQDCNKHFNSMIALKDHMKEHYKGWGKSSDNLNH